MRNHRRRRTGPVPANTGPGIILALLLTFTLSASAAGPATRANDDSCDIALLPAATLLLPYFEVSFTDVTNQVTLFTVTNVTHVAQIARVTLWTDHSYPVLTFNIYLTGYDTQSISLFDVIAKGIIGNGTGTSISHAGEYSDPNTQLDETACANLPGSLDTALVTRMQDAFTLGVTTACNAIGGEHENAVGYATIDVVGNCSAANATDPKYFTNDIRFDNALIGDYQQISGKLETYAEVSPMVHIRAIPEGGTPTSRLDAGEVFGNRFPSTFYGRFQNPLTPTADARQPLPSRFAARWINDGSGEFFTYLKVWRQSATGRNIDCAQLDDNALLPVTDLVMFDPDENGEGTIVPTGCDPIPCGESAIAMPSTSLSAVAPGSAIFQQALLSTNSSGWLYFDLDDGNPENGAHQNWVVVSMHAANIFGGAMDAAALGNGCSPPVGLAEQSQNGSAVIGPAEDGEP